jgi:hypothetical protein
MATALPAVNNPAVVLAADIEKVLLDGDLKVLTPDQRISYYNAVCASLSLNPLTKPFAYLHLNGKTVLYALKDCAEQLRNVRGVSLTILSREIIEGVYVVTSRAMLADGRTDEATGAVAIDGLKGEFRANAMMKAETKSKRRVTLSICGLGLLDESEIETVRGAVEISDEPLALPPAKETAPPKPNGNGKPGDDVALTMYLARLKSGADTEKVYKEINDRIKKLSNRETVNEEWAKAASAKNASPTAIVRHMYGVLKGLTPPEPLPDPQGGQPAPTEENDANEDFKSL